MSYVLFRTGSTPINSSPLPNSPRLSFSGFENAEFSPMLHFNTNKINNRQRRRRICRTVSVSEAIFGLRSIKARSRSFPEAVLDEDVSGGTTGIGSVKSAEKCLDRISEIPADDISEFTGVGSGSGRDRNGFGSGRSSGENNDNDNDNERNKICAYYRKLLELNPNDPLLLRNYGKFLHEVGDSVKAEECYGRAILANPGDGELLSLFGKLIWDAHRDGERAQTYFDQAISASPDDCMVMGSYAQFMWEAEEDDDIEEESGSKLPVPAAEAMVEGLQVWIE